MSILVTGVNGQLGHDVIEELNRRGIPAVGIDKDDLDITDSSAVHAYIRDLQPTAVIHCAAYTAVDKAETEPEECYKVNRDGTRYIAEACRDNDSSMLYISTDYVFPGVGDIPFETDDETGPMNVYGASKLAGETAVKEILTKYYIVRISWLFGTNGHNYVKTMLKLSQTRDSLTIVDDQVGSPTYSADLAVLLCDIITSERYGTYHAHNEGECSWAEFSREIFKLAGRDTSVIPICSEEYETLAVRPKNSRLSLKSLDDAGFAHLPHWRDALKRYLLIEISEKDNMSQ
ncbi:MAG: dTDP-4-dehydrorhamnose reductase [Solobacterium sp.]|nr:dTDP-4-dehydrorhamnose reductase [Solobacterium sp.]